MNDSYATHFLTLAIPSTEFTTAAAFIASTLSATCSHTFESPLVLIASSLRYPFSLPFTRSVDTRLL